MHGWLTLSFLGQMVTDWLGENGRLDKLTGSYRGINIVREEILCKGQVTKKYQDDGGNRARLEIWAENPQGERTVSAMPAS